MSAVMSPIERRVNDRRVDVQDLLNAADRRHSSRRFDDISYERRPELAHLGVEFLASKGHARGYGVCETEAIDDLNSQIAEHHERLREKQDSERVRYGFGSGE